MARMHFLKLISFPMLIPLACQPATGERLDAATSSAARPSVDARAPTKLSEGGVAPTRTTVDGSALSPRLDAGPSPDGSVADTVVDLVEPSSWRAVAADDPFAPWREEPTDCSPIAGYYTEEQTLEVDTGRCNFVTLWQPSKIALSAGAVLELEVVHFDLTSESPAEARVAIHVGEPTVDFPSWQQRIAIPGTANTIVDRFTLTRAVPQGTPLWFHLQNHGQNTWRLIRVQWLTTAS